MSMHRVVAIAASLLVGLTALSAPVSAQTTASPGVVGSSYTSPNFGYSLSWDPSWSVLDETSGPGHDYLELTNQVSLLSIEGYATTNHLAACMAEQEALFTNVESFSQLAPATTSSGEPNLGSTPTTSYAGYTWLYTADDGSTADMAGYVECVTLEAGASQFVITHLAEAADYEQQVAAREAIIAGIVLPGAEAGSQAPESAAAPATTSELEQFMLASASDIDQFWAQNFVLVRPDVTYLPPAAIVLYDQSDVGMATGCGPITEDIIMNAFYCSQDTSIYLSVPYAQESWDTMGLLFPVSATIAHEFGHHIQQLMQLESCDISPCLDPTQATSQETETMADCFLGAWARDAESRQLLGNLDVEAAIVNRATRGDANEGGEVGAHGDGALRAYWFLAGYYFGAEGCLGAARATASGSQTDGATETTVESPGAPAAVTAGAIGMPFTVGSMTMTVSGAEQLAGIDAGDGGMTALRPQGKYVVVHLTVTTDAPTPTLFDFGNLLLTDGAQQGYYLDEQATAVASVVSFPDGLEAPLQAGHTYQLSIVFDVPQDASGFTIQGADGTNPVPLGI